MFSLATQVFHFSKPNTLVSWAHDIVSSLTPRDVDQGNRTALFIAEASALHFAAMQNLPKICRWLIENGCDVNRKTVLGTPLHCALLSGETFNVPFWKDETNCFSSMDFEPHETVSVLLKAGADPNVCLEVPSGTYPPLFLASLFDGRELTLDLLEKGAQVNDRVVDLRMERFKDDRCEDIDDEACKFLQYVFEHGRYLMLRDETRARVELHMHKAYTAKSRSSAVKINYADENRGREIRCHEVSLRTAAEFGRVNATLALLDTYSVEIDAVEEISLLTALHKAVKKDQVEVAQILWNRGASLTKVDSTGRNALHHSINEQGCRCLSFLLKQDPEIYVTDNEDLTIWHIAALRENVEDLKILLNHSKLFEGGSNMLTRINGNSLVSYACQSGSALAVSLLLDAGCSVLGVDCDEYSALHHAAKSGLADGISLLLSQGLNITQTTNDGSTVIHCAASGDSARLNETLDILLAYGIDPFVARKDGMTPIELVVQERKIKSKELTRASALQIFANSSDSFEGKKKALDRALIVLCTSCPSQDSTWLPDGLSILLENGANIMHITPTGEPAFADLINVWKKNCSTWFAKYNALTNTIQESKDCEPSMLTSTEMMINALNHTPFQGPAHEICTDANLLYMAMRVSTVWILEQATKDTVDRLIGKLLERSPNVDQIVGDDNSTLMKYACRACSNMPTLGNLLQLSTALSDEALGSELVREASYRFDDDDRIPLKLLEAGLDPNGRSETGQTALMIAAGWGNVRIVKTLLAHGSDVNIRDDVGQSPAHHACSKDFSGVLEVLDTLKDT